MITGEVLWIKNDVRKLPIIRLYFVLSQFFGCCPYELLSFRIFQIYYLLLINHCGDFWLLSLNEDSFFILVKLDLLTCATAPHESTIQMQFSLYCLFSYITNSLWILSQLMYLLYMSIPRWTLSILTFNIKCICYYRTCFLTNANECFLKKDSLYRQRFFKHIC